MHANLPEIAKRWERDYASGGIARVGYQQGNQVFPFNTNPIHPPTGSVIPPDMGTYNYQHPRGTDIIGMDEMNTYGQLPRGTDTIGMNEMFSYPRIKPDYNFGQDIDQTYREGDFNVSPQQLSWYNKMFNKAGQGITGLKNQMGNIFTGAKNKGGALMGNIMGMATGIPFLGSMLGNIRPDNPYEKFQKQMFSDMYGGHDFGNKDPFGKNVRSLFGNYDVIEQADKFMNSKLGQKRNFAEVMADGIITQEEIDKYGLDQMGSTQLNRLKTLAAAKQKATNWRANREDTRRKHRDANLITSKMTHDGGAQTYTPITKHHGDIAHGEGGRFAAAPKAKHHGNVAHGPGGRFNQPAASSSSGRDYGPHRKAEGGIISLWPK